MLVIFVKMRKILCHFFELTNCFSLFYNVDLYNTCIFAVLINERQYCIANEMFNALNQRTKK